MQTRTMSMAEKLTDSASGVVISWLLTMAVLPAWFGFQADAKISAEITAIYTAVSIVRGYFWRRIFNKMGRC